MPLPVTPYFEQRLASLHALSPDVAKLAEAIADAQLPEVLAESAHSQTEKLFDRLDAVACQQTRCVYRLGVWLYSLVAFKALTRAHADVFIDFATVLGGPDGVVENEHA